MFVRLINGIATAIATTATGTIAAHVTPVERKSEGISLFSLSLVLGTAIGPFFGILLLKSFSINLLFAICVVLGVISLIISLFIKIDFDAVHNNTDAKLLKHQASIYTTSLQRSSTSINSYDGYCTKLCFNTDFLEIFCRTTTFIRSF